MTWDEQIRSWRICFYGWLRLRLVLVVDKRDRELMLNINAIGNSAFKKILRDEIARREALGER